MGWIALILAACFEVVGVIGLTMVNQRPAVRSYLVLVGGFVLSFAFLSIAMQEVEMGTAYAVWSGVGTVGGVLVGMFFYGEPKDKLRLMFIMLVVFSVVGLKLIS